MPAASAPAPTSGAPVAPPIDPSAAVPVVPRSFKASELPLSSAVRSAIEGLVHTFKKKGGYDTIRKQAWEKFEASVSCPVVFPVVCSVVLLG